MKGTVTDPAVLGAVRPHDLAAYLHAHGWRPRLASPDDPLADWVRETDAGGIEISIPRHPGWRDYARRVREAVAEISRVESRAELEILQDICALRAHGPVPAFDVEGIVVALDRPGQDRAGHVGVAMTMNGRTQKVWIEVDGDDWDCAIEAMRHRRVVRYRGELVRQGRSYLLLRNPRNSPDVAGDENGVP
jgi:hypothetical protein